MAVLATEPTSHHKSHHKPLRPHRDATRLTRRAGIYHFRRRDPFGRSSEITVSLRTRNYREAQWLAESLDAHLVSQCLPTMTIEEIRALCHALLGRLLEDDRARRLEYRERGRPVFASRHHLEDRDGDIQEADKEAFADDAQFWRDVLAEGDFDAVSETVDEILEGREVNDVERRTLSVGVIEAFIKAREMGEARQRRMFERLVRDRQPLFRRDLLAAYEGRCAITRCSIEACLEAAHFDRYAVSGDNRVCNGILLRADLHRLMDAGLLTFRWSKDGLTASIAVEARHDEYRLVHGRVVWIPTEPELQPSRAAVDAHRREARSQ